MPPKSLQITLPPPPQVTISEQSLIEILILFLLCVFQNVLISIRDVSHLQEWVPGIHKVRRVTAINNDTDISKLKTSMQYDVISMETNDTSSQVIGLINSMSQTIQGQPLVRKVKVVHRSVYKSSKFFFPFISG